MSNDDGVVEIAPLTLHIGAEISGVDLSRPLSEATREAIYDAFLKWKVVFFRDQNLNHTSHIAFSRRMGEPTIGHAVFGHVEVFAPSRPAGRASQCETQFARRLPCLDPRVDFRNQVRREGFAAASPAAKKGGHFRLGQRCRGGDVPAVER